MTNQANSRAWFALVAIALIAVNLRPGATSLGPVLAEVTEGLGLDGVMAGVLTSLPGFTFAGAAVLAVGLGLRFGLATTLAAGLGAVTVGLLLRTFSGEVAVFLVLTLLAFTGMGIGNVLVPAYIKRTFAGSTFVPMAVYTTFLAVGATTAGLASAPLARLSPGGWRAALGAWGVVALVATVPWVVLAVRERRHRRLSPVVGPRPSGSMWGVMRSRKGIALALFFGMQSMQAYVQFGWTAQMYRDGGVDSTEAGLLFALIPAFGIPAGLLMPAVAEKMRDPRPVIVLFGALLAGGWLGIWLAPTTLSWLWATMLGISGVAFPLAIALIAARTRDPHVTAQVSGFTQSVGYLFSGLGPLLVGVLYQATGGWAVPLGFLVATSVVFTLSGLVASTPGAIDDELAAAASR